MIRNWRCDIYSISAVTWVKFAIKKENKIWVEMILDILRTSQNIQNEAHDVGYF